MLTLRARLTLGVLGLITVLVLGLTLLENLALRGFLVEGEATRVRAQAKAAIDAAARTDLDTRQAQLLATDLTSADTGALVLAVDGSLLGRPREGTVGAPAPVDVPADAVARAAAGDREVDVIRDGTSGRELLVFVPEPGADPPRAVVVLSAPLDDDDAVAQQQFLSGLGGLLVVLTLAGVGSLLLVRRTLRPLDRISRTAALVASGDLGQRVHLGGPPDEVGLLAESFDGMTEALQRSFDELAQSERRSREFVADASHELRTPLTTVAGFTDVLLRRPSDDADATRLLASLRREVDRMQRVVDDLLLLARADQRLGSARIPLDLRHAAMRVAEQLRPVAGSRSLIVDGGPVWVSSDPDRVHRILLNLVGNAVRHTTENGTIVLTTDDADGHGSVTVSDDGEGMDDAIRATAFERFTRGAARRGTGSGLGLAIVVSLVEELDGRVDLDSALGEGTSVRVRLGFSKVTGSSPIG